MTHDQEREKFEAWYRQEYSFSGKFGVFASGDYVSEHTHKKWHVWQEAWQAAKREPVVSEHAATLVHSADDAVTSSIEDMRTFFNERYAGGFSAAFIIKRANEYLDELQVALSAHPPEAKDAIRERIATYRELAQIHNAANGYTNQQSAIIYRKCADEIEAALTTPRGG